MGEMQNQTSYSRLRVITSGILAVYYFGRIIALIGERGLILWFDVHEPLFLIEYLIENPPPVYRWN
jgi:hypothetical protein